MKIQQAREVLGLGERASLKEIKKAYRALTHQWHPDKCRKKERAECQEKMKEINQAYETVMKHVETYRYSLVPKKDEQEDLRDFWRDRFGSDPAWGGGG